MQGWVKLQRDLLDWEWYTHTPTKTLFIHLLLKANDKEAEYRGKLIKRGALVTSRELLAKETGLTVRQVRTALKNLETTHETTHETTRQGTYIQLVNYDNYLGATHETTSERPRKDPQVSNKNNSGLYYSKGHLRLTMEEYNKLLKSYSPSIIDAYISKIENWKKNDKVKSVYLTISKWIEKDNKILAKPEVKDLKEVTVNTGFNEHF